MHSNIRKRLEHIRDISPDIILHSSEQVRDSLNSETRIELKRRGKVASGRLLRSSFAKIGAINRNGVVIYYSYGTARRAGKRYGFYVEYGRRMNRRPPPPSAILTWLRNKRIRVYGKGGKSGAAVRIALSIGKRGILDSRYSYSSGIFNYRIFELVWRRHIQGLDGVRTVRDIIIDNWRQV